MCRSGSLFSPLSTLMPYCMKIFANMRCIVDTVDNHLEHLHIVPDGNVFRIVV